MPYANNQGVRIHYQVAGEGPPLVMCHGLGASLRFWHITGYVDALEKDCQLILVDPRGHGMSDKPHDPEAYAMALRVADVVAVLDELKISQPSYCGYSLGGWTGWAIAKYAPERFHSLIIGGSSPYGDAPQGLDFLELFKQGRGATLATVEEMFGARWTPEVEAMFAANDLDALIALLSVWEDLDFDELLPAIGVPCLLFGGDQDPFYSGAEECARRMPRATSVSLPGLDHIEAQYRPDLVVPHIRELLEKVSQA